MSQRSAQNHAQGFLAGQSPFKRPTLYEALLSFAFLDQQPLAEADDLQAARARLQAGFWRVGSSSGSERSRSKTFTKQSSARSSSRQYAPQYGNLSRHGCCSEIDYIAHERNDDVLPPIEEELLRRVESVFVSIRPSTSETRTIDQLPFTVEPADFQQATDSLNNREVLELYQKPEEAPGDEHYGEPQETDHTKPKSRTSPRPGARLLNPSTHSLRDRPRLRGGGDDGDHAQRLAKRSAKWRGQEAPRTMLFLPTPAPLPDNARVPAAVWWLAGGKISRGGKVPTAGELRQRRKVETANREAVGFWGTLFGVRKIRTMRDLGEGYESGLTSTCSRSISEKAGEGGSQEVAAKDAVEGTK